MSEFIQLLILAYFKEFKTNYSIVDLAQKLGCSTSLLLEYLDSLIQKGLLAYESDLLRLTLRGRIILFEMNMDNYSFKQDIHEQEVDKWELDHIYCPLEFSKEKWRGNLQM